MRKRPTPFRNDNYFKINKARMEHLASLGLPLQGKKVLEVGAGLGDLSGFFLNRDCDLTITEAREENLKVCREAHPDVEIHKLNMDALENIPPKPYEVIFCYGLLYHLTHPETAVEWMAKSCTDMLLLELVCSVGNQPAKNVVRESDVISQSFTGHGCRPTRPWVFSLLKEHFEHVYATKTQPDHKWYPLNWNKSVQPARSVFIASRTPLDNDLLLTDLPMLQERYSG